MNERFRRTRDLFEAALEVAGDERTGWLHQACAEDPDLEREVSVLLRASQQEGLLDEPILPPAAEPPSRPDHLGPYEILDEIGRGGMGTVYRAVRTDETFRKVVAIKVIGGAGLDRGLTDRFQRERQILATLEHPNIARILDGGSVGNAPYLVMEYVEGERIDQYCESRRLTVRERLALFSQVCAAVDYAHRNLIVHRDLKPGNVLVTADGTVKLLDFGIAKMLSPEEQPLATMTLQLTPDYASPEQFRGDRVTPASDVYSLGVMLFQLLTGGERPRRTTGSNLMEIARNMSQENPPAPSTKAPAGVRGELIGDLDCIVLAALAADPERRYASAGRLADDLERFRNRLPVWAHADSRAYRARKFVSQYRVLLSAAVTVVLALSLGVVTTAIQRSRAEQALVVAEAQRKLAERRYQDVRSLATGVLFDIYDQIRGLEGASEARRVAATKALQYIDGLYQQSHDDMGLAAELASAYERVGDILGNIADSSVEGAQAALPPYTKALSLRERVAASKPGDAAAREALARAHEHLGVGYLGVGKGQEAVASFEAALRLENDRPSFRAEMSDRLCSAYALLSDFDRSLGYCREALTLVQSPQIGLAAADRDKLTARIMRQYGIFLRLTGRNREAITWLNDAAGRLSILVRKEPDQASLRRSYASMLPMLARAYEDTGQAVEADKAWNNARTRLADILPSSSTDSQVVLALSYTLKRIAWNHYHAFQAGKGGETGEAEMRQALEYSERMAVRPQAGVHEMIEYADTLVKAPFPRLQNPQRALTFALRANQLSNFRDPLELDTLAWAYFRTGNVAVAIQTMEKALGLLPGSAESFRKELQEGLGEFRKAASTQEIDRGTPQ
jgi:tetratricopeptide (TPR) repeat protein